MSKWNVFAACSLISIIHATNLLGGFNMSFVVRTPLKRVIDKCCKVINPIVQESTRRNFAHHRLLIDDGHILLSLLHFSPELSRTPAYTPHCRAKPKTGYMAMSLPSTTSTRRRGEGTLREIAGLVTVKRRRLALHGLGNTTHTIPMTTDHHPKICVLAKADVLNS